MKLSKSAVVLSMIVILFSTSAAAEGIRSQLDKLREERQKSNLAVQNKNFELTGAIQENQKQFQRAMMDFQEEKARAAREGDGGKVLEINQKMKALRQQLKLENQKDRIQNKKEREELKAKRVVLQSQIKQLNAAKG